jgi:acyl carrier protein
MEREDIIQEVNGFLIDEFEIEEDLVHPSASWKQLGIDSLDFVDIVVIVERSFGFKLKGEEMVKIKTLDEFYNFIHDRQQIN